MAPTRFRRPESGLVEDAIPMPRPLAHGSSSESQIKVSLIPDGKSIIRFCALLVNLRVPLYDSVPEVLDHQGGQIHSVGEGDGGEALAYKARPFNLNQPSIATAELVWKRRHSIVKNEKINPQKAEKRLNEILNETIVLSLCRNNQNIVNIIGVAFAPTDEPQLQHHWDPILLLEYSQLGNLDSFIKKSQKTLPVLVKLSFARDIGLGLQFVHDQGLIWADAKPKNILVFYSDRPFFQYVVKLADFGASQKPVSFWNRGGFPAGEGEKGWTSPFSVCWNTGRRKFLKSDREKQCSKSDHEKQCFHFDIFNLGLILLWMLVGEGNFQESDVGPMNHHPPVGCTSVSGYFKQVNFSEKAERALDRHLESLRSNGYSIGMSRADVGRTKQFFRDTLTYKPCDKIDLVRHISRLQSCLPFVAQRPEESGTALSTPGVEESQRKVDISQIRSFLRKFMATRRLETTLETCNSHYLGEFVEGIPPLLPDWVYKGKEGQPLVSMIKEVEVQPLVSTSKGVEGRPPVSVSKEEGQPIPSTGHGKEVFPEQERPAHDFYDWCDILDIQELEKSSTKIDYSALDEAGLAPLARVIMDDDPVIQRQRQKLLGDDYLERQLEVVELLLKRGADPSHCSAASDTILTMAARHASLSLLQNICNGRENMIHQISISADGTPWTPIRAAMARQGELGVLKSLLRTHLSLDNWRGGIPRFENDYTYLHLCAFLEHEWSAVVADALFETNLVSQVELAEDGKGLQLSAFTLALLRDNLALAKFLHHKNPEVAYVSVIPPAVLPPAGLNAWHEACIFPPSNRGMEEDFRGSRYVLQRVRRSLQFVKHRVLRVLAFIHPSVGGFFDRLGELMDFRPGEYRSEQLAEELSGQTRGRVWTTLRRRQRLRLCYRVLVEFALDSGFRGPFMYNWIQYRSPLDHLVMTGKRRTACGIAELLLKSEPNSHGRPNSDYRLVERAIGEGLRQIYTFRNSRSSSTAHSLYPGKPGKGVDMALENTIIGLVKLLQRYRKGQAEHFFERVIRLDDFTKPDSFFDEGRFLFGIAPESITSLCHLAVFGGLLELVKLFDLPEMKMIRDGGGQTPLELAIEELKAEQRKRENDSPGYSEKREKDLKQIMNRLSGSKAEIRVSYLHGYRGFIQTTMWTTTLVLMQLLPIRVLWRFSNKVCNLLLLAIELVWTFVTILAGVVSVISLALQSLSRLREWLIAFGVVLSAVAILFIVDVLLLSFQHMSCRYWSYRVYLPSFGFVIILIYLATFFALKLPRLYQAILLSKKREKYMALMVN